MKNRLKIKLNEPIIGLGPLNSPLNPVNTSHSRYILSSRENRARRISASNEQLSTMSCKNSRLYVRRK